MITPLSGTQLDTVASPRACGLEGEKSPGVRTRRFQSARSREGFFVSTGLQPRHGDTGRLPQPRTCGPARMGRPFTDKPGVYGLPDSALVANRDAVAGIAYQVRVLTSLIRERGILVKSPPSSGGLVLWR